MKDVKVVFPHMCEKYCFKEGAREYLGERFISKELTFSVALVRNIYHQNDFPKGRMALCPSHTARKETFTCL